MSRRVAILGGGMAGLAAAWSLSASDDVEVTVYQRGWRLGGKGASSRGPDGRIEEHGLHVWLGYYDNAFRLMREVYDALERPPGCPIRSWRDAFAPAHQVGVEDRVDGAWRHWVATFATNDQLPGEGAPGEGPLQLGAFVQRGLGLLLDFSRSLRPPQRQPVGVFLSASPEPPAPDVDAFAGVVRQAELAALIGAVESLRVMEAAVPRDSALAAGLLEGLQRTREDLVARLREEDDGRRAWQLADLLVACLQGALRDELLGETAAFATIDDLDFREWLAGHGAHADTLASPLIRGLYDLVFAYEGGDQARPRFSAGLGLFLATKLFFDYKGAIFWRMRAGMGDVVFAPLYEALRARGVRFEFFHRVERLHVSGGRVRSVTFGRQACVPEFEPLTSVKGLPCFSSAPPPGCAADLESHGSDRTTEERVELTDFDDVVLAVSLGMVPHVCPELVASSPRWRAMVEHVATVPTQAFQIWLRPNERELGWPYPGATVSAYVTPFDTYASMSELLALEDWAEPPGSLGYFCSVLGDEQADVGASTREFLEAHAAHYWPGASAADGSFRWELVQGLYWRANVDPSDRYVQSLPGSARHRLRADESGVENLFLAGDWINCGLNAGCVEAAVLAGHQAANAVRGRPLMDDVLGAWCSL